MYSDIPGGSPAYNYIFITDQCGNYAAEGDCYNREHSFPKSWFDDQPPMNTDLFHIYPTDGYVNGKRSNYPYGEVNSPAWTSTNTSKLGNNTFPGYNGTVFEPIDEYKGDFARTYFYMMTRYMDRVSLWESDMLSGGDLSSWARSLLMEWHEDDPVSTKETNRNNAVYDIQDNRNPFIDHPGWVEEIWGTPSLIDEDAKQNIKLWIDGGILYLDGAIDGKDGILELFNLSGQTLYSSVIKGKPFQTLVNLPPGIYLARYVHSKYAATLKFTVTSR
jgi:endonuclease I